MRRFYSLLLVCAIAMTAFLLTGCNEDSKNDETKAEISVSKDSNDLVVKTDYFNLYYPASWEELVRAEVEEKDGEEIVAFYGVVGDHEKEMLFEINFNSSEGEVLGKFCKDDKTIPVSMNVPEFEFDETWNSDEQTTLYAMQEEVNYVVQSMNSIDGFIPAE